jgi:hypothetical protein
MSRPEVMYDKKNLPKKLVQEIELIDLLNSFPHLVKPQIHKIKGIGSTNIRMSHSDMSFSEYYEYLKGYSGIADVEVKPAKKSLLGKDKPLRLVIYDKKKRNIYSEGPIDSEKIKGLISRHYALARQTTVERVLRDVEDGEYQIDKNSSTDERFERKRYRYLFLYSTGGKTDLKNCMLAYKLSKEEISEALKHRVWINEKRKGDEDVEDDAENGENQESSKKTKIAQRLVLKRFDIFFSLDNLHKIVFQKM